MSDEAGVKGMEGVEFLLPPPQASLPITMEVVRELTPEDIPHLLNTPVVTKPAPPLARVTAAHHETARLIALGKSPTEVSILTGYSPAYISSLKRDPTFGELLSTYSAERDIVFADVLERMKILGLSTLDEIQARLAEKPEDWTRRELMELAELLLVKGRLQAGGPLGGGFGGSAAPVQVNVNFVTAKAGVADNAHGPMIEGELA